MMAFGKSFIVYANPQLRLAYTSRYLHHQILRYGLYGRQRQ
jgi:hypothetical protein